MYAYFNNVSLDMSNMRSMAREGWRRSSSSLVKVLRGFASGNTVIHTPNREMINGAYGGISSAKDIKHFL